MSESQKRSGLAQSGAPPNAATFGRYVLYSPIARGGMATVHIARLVGAEGFTRIVAAKRLHEQYAEDEDFVTMFLDEARISSKLHHPNVVSVLDVVHSGTDLVLVQEYVHGVPLDKLVKAAEARGERLPVRVAVAIVCGTLLGLHSAHTATDELGEPLHIVHRDVSPQNVIVSTDGIPRLLDFGIAKARSSAHITQEGFFKGKIAYIPPEQLRGEPPALTTDIYAAGVVLWELLVGRRMHAGRGETELFSAVLSGALPTVEEAIGDQREALGEERLAELDRVGPVVSKALAMNASDRYTTAEEMADALRAAIPPATASELSTWVRELGADFLEARQRVIMANEESWRSTQTVPASASAASVAGGFASGIQPVHPRKPAPVAGAKAGAPMTPDRVPSIDVAEESSPMKRWSRVGPPLILVFLLAGAGLFVASRAEQAGAVPAATDPGPTGAALAPIAPPAPADLHRATGGPPQADFVVAPPHAKALAAAVPPAPRPTPPPPPPPRPAHPGAQSAPSAPAPSTASSCNPPYYFDGTKKLFKPGCI